MPRARKYNKLVRDRIPEIIRLRGGCPVVRRADAEEYWEKLREKLKEEVKEFLAEAKDGDQAAMKEELADILEVINAIACHLKCGEDELEIIRIKKAEERGGFNDRVILDQA